MYGPVIWYCRRRASAHSANHWVLLTLFGSMGEEKEELEMPPPPLEITTPNPTTLSIEVSSTSPSAVAVCHESEKTDADAQIKEQNVLICNKLIHKISVEYARTDNSLIFCICHLLFFRIILTTYPETELFFWSKRQYIFCIGRSYNSQLFFVLLTCRLGSVNTCTSGAHDKAGSQQSIHATSYIHQVRWPLLLSDYRIRVHGPDVCYDRKKGIAFFQGLWFFIKYFVI